MFGTLKPKKDTAPKPTTDLTVDEIQLILQLLSQTTFPVSKIETLYVAIYKLQEIHKQLKGE